MATGADGVAGCDLDLKVRAHRLHGDVHAAEPTVAVWQVVGEPRFPLEVPLLLEKVGDAQHHAKSIVHALVRHSGRGIRRGGDTVLHDVLSLTILTQVATCGYKGGISPIRSRSAMIRSVASIGGRALRKPSARADCPSRIGVYWDGLPRMVSMPTRASPTRKPSQ